MAKADFSNFKAPPPPTPAQVKGFERFRRRMKTATGTLVGRLEFIPPKANR